MSDHDESRPKQRRVYWRIPDNWDEMSEEEQDAWGEAFIRAVLGEAEED